MVKPTIICLMGPTASGKTPLAVELVKRFQCEIISVDSAMVYRSMDIGTAKPSFEILKQAPHRLLDVIDPADHYSAGNFCRDALREIQDIVAHDKIPLLVGGSMMYFRALQKGMASMPPRDAMLREAFIQRAKVEGWPALHRTLQQVDPAAAERIHPSDSQRIQRALEVFMLTSKSITEIQHETTYPLADYNVINLGLNVEPRALLHERIAARFHAMLQQGFIHEVHRLYQRGDLTQEMPSMRSVGYRQAWKYLAGDCSLDDMVETAIAATRQLAKRQLTWLRTWPELHWFDACDPALAEQVEKFLRDNVKGIR